MQRKLIAAFSLLMPLTCSSWLPAEPVAFPTAASKRPILKSIYAGLHQVSDFKKKDTKAIVCVFLSVDCPVSRQYASQLSAMHERFKKDHVQFVGIYPNARVDIMSMAMDAFENNFPFPVFQDQEQKLAKLFEVAYMPEVVVLDGKLQKRYQGAIDDQFQKRGRIAEAREHYLVDALTQIVAGEEVTRDFVPASGCPLEIDTPKRADRKFTFYKHVLPILQAKCQGCHRESGIAPFELKSYEDAAFSVARIKEAVSDRRMPPWHGFLNPKFGKIANDQSLTDSELETVLSWCENGAPEGIRTDAPKPIQWPDPKAWGIENPDYVFKFDKPFKVPKSGTLEYQFFRVKMNFAEDRWVQAVEVKPGNSEVVHHVGLHLVEASNKQLSGMFAMTQLYGLNTERARLINDYVPGDLYNAKTYPSHQAVRIPKNSDLIFEVHYTPNGKAEAFDQSMVAFRWADNPPEEEVFTRVFRKAIGRFRIPPHASHHRIEDTYHFAEDIDLDAVRPHFHLRGKSFLLEIVERNAETDEIEKLTPIIKIPVFDSGWQRTYELAQPLRLRAGTELRAVGHFDNSSLNPNNPNPNVAVDWGQQTSDEMFSTRFKYRAVKTSQR